MIIQQHTQLGYLFLIISLILLEWSKWLLDEGQESKVIYLEMKGSLKYKLLIILQQYVDFSEI